MSTDVVTADAEIGLPVEPLETESHRVETKHVTADGDIVVVEAQNYDLPTRPKNLGNQFRAGAQWTGNKGGRPKGVKNRITVQRLLMEEQLRDRLAVNAPDLLEKAILMALAGDNRIMGLLLDKLMATPKNDADDAAKDTHISVTIRNSTTTEKPAIPHNGKVKVITVEEPVDGEIL